MQASTFVITPHGETVLPVEGEGHYPVRRIYCVGRNYLSHIREMHATALLATQQKLATHPSLKIFNMR